MSRNGGGTYALPEPPFIPGTVISSTDMNSNFDDIADALTDSLSRTGLGAMQAQLLLTTAGLAYSSDPDTGISRPDPNTQVITVGGEDWTFTEDDVTAPDGVSLLPLIGEIRMWALPSAPTGWLFMRGQECTTDYPLWRAALVAASSPFGTSGGNPLFPDLQCRLPAGFDADGLGLLTGATVFGAEIGQQSRTIAQANLPSVNFTVTIPAGQGLHDHPYAGPPLGQTARDGDGTPALWFGSSVPLLVTAATLPAMSGTAASGGSGTALTTIQPTLVINFIGRAA